MVTQISSMVGTWARKACQARFRVGCSVAAGEAKDMGAYWTDFTNPWWDQKAGADPPKDLREGPYRTSKKKKDKSDEDRGEGYQGMRGTNHIIRLVSYQAAGQGSG